MPMAGTKSPLHGSELFLDKKNRDDRYNELKGMGKNVTRSTVHNQRLDPRFIEDSGKSKDLGFGNDYNHFFPKLFSIRRKDFTGITYRDDDGLSAMAPGMSNEDKKPLSHGMGYRDEYGGL
jgi:hypothetical protein